MSRLWCWIRDYLNAGRGRRGEPRRHTTRLFVETLETRVVPITNGILDGIAHPNVGAVLIVEPPADRPNLKVPHVQCSGTLIHPGLFLTAGHCTDNLEQRIEEGLLTLDDMRVSFGSKAYDPTTWLEISGWVTHPEYDRNTFPGFGAVPSSDIGVLILKEPLEGVTPATLASEGLLDYLTSIAALRGGYEGTPITVVGYGSDVGDPPGHVQTTRDGLRRVAQAEFHHLQEEWLFLSQNVSQGEGGAGFADSGGPAFWVDPDTGDEILVATSARGDASTVAMGIFYRSDIVRTIAFIDSVIAVIDCGESLTAATAAPRPVNDFLSGDELQPILAEVLGRWQFAGLETTGRGNVQFHIANLGGATIGQASGNTIWLDDNAAGWGWFVDTTPWNDSEFTTPGNQGEQGHMDLLTAIAHEVGHLLGFDHSDRGVMDDILDSGVRAMPVMENVFTEPVVVDSILAFGWSDQHYRHPDHALESLGAWIGRSNRFGLGRDNTSRR